MTFSPQLEERFAKMLACYPEGRKRSAVVPMLIYAQDEAGAITPELIEEVARRCGVAPLAGGRSGRLLFDAAPQAAGQVSRPGLHQHQLHAGGRRGAVRTRQEKAGHRAQGGDRGRAVFARRSGVHGRLLLGAGGGDQLRFSSLRDAGAAGSVDRRL